MLWDIDTVYYSEFYNTIPLGIVNKRVTGIGLTSYALENEIPTVVCVPTIGIIENKVDQYPNSRRSESILGVYGGKVEDSHIDYYTRHTKIPKIIVTYDSFHRVVKHINKRYHIIIDEFSELLDAYSYREKAIRDLLNQLTKLSNEGYEMISYVSATPLDKKYLPSELKELPYHELDFGELEKVKIGTYKTGKPYLAAANYIDSFKVGLLEVNGIKPEALYFFINSVTDICSIISSTNLSSHEVRVICSDTKDNYKKLKSVGIKKIETALDDEKPINFVTSRCFKGTDFYSEKGLAIVVSNCKKSYTLLTIDTDIYQIAGRIRNDDNPFKGYLVHIFNENPNDLNDEDFNNLVAEKEGMTEDLINVFHKCTDREKSTQLKAIDKMREEAYITIFNGEPVYDELSKLNDERIYHDVIKVYREGLTINRYKSDSKFEVNKQFKIDVEYYARKSFYSIAKKYDEGEISEEIAFKLYPQLQVIVDRLGKDRLKTNGYNISRLTKELDDLTRYSEFNVEDQIRNLFSNGDIKPLIDNFYSISDINFALQKLYRDNNLGYKVKSTLISKLFDAKKSTRKINNQTINGYVIFF